jgi:hypothetical protein
MRAAVRPIAGKWIANKTLDHAAALDPGIVLPAVPDGKLRAQRDAPVVMIERRD